MQTTPKGLRLHIGIFGRRNVGKSSLLNALTHESVSIVSDVAGTTTDPVEKPMELQPIGPVVFIDTAGIDDTGALGTQRTERTRSVFDRVDLGIVVAAADEWTDFEEQLLDELRRRRTPTIVVQNKADLAAGDLRLRQRLAALQTKCLPTVAVTGDGVDALRSAIAAAVPDEFLGAQPIVGDLVPSGELVVLVVPIDLEAPKGRLILPQVQTIRDLLDHDCCCLMVKEDRVDATLRRLNRPPALVVTDSQAFQRVAAEVPLEVPLTSFSILFARFKGDLKEFAHGALSIQNLRPGDRVLIAEACAHHPLAMDIGRVKIPQWLQDHVGGPLAFTHVQGHDFPPDLVDYRLVIHCGACMLNRREVLARIARCREAGVPITNYGLAIACTLGILERALAPFRSCLLAANSEKGRLLPRTGQGTGHGR